MFISRKDYDALISEIAALKSKNEMLEQMLVLQRKVNSEAPSENKPQKKGKKSKGPSAPVSDKFDGTKVYYNMPNEKDFVCIHEAEEGHGVYKRYPIDGYCCGHYILGNYYDEPDQKTGGKWGWAFIKDKSGSSEIPNWTAYYAKICDACRQKVTEIKQENIKEKCGSNIPDFALRLMKGSDAPVFTGDSDSDGNFDFDSIFN